MAKQMTWEGLHPVVTLSRKVYNKGITLGKAAMQAVEARLERHPALPKYDILIKPGANILKGKFFPEITLVGTKFTRPSVERLSRTAFRRILGSLPFLQQAGASPMGIVRSSNMGLADTVLTASPPRSFRQPIPSVCGRIRSRGTPWCTRGRRVLPSVFPPSAPLGATVGLTPGVAGLGTPHTRAERIR